MTPKYEDEDRIIWLKDHDALASMGYVRQSWQLASIRTGPLKAPSGEILIGYAVLKKTADKAGEKGFWRRVFTLRPEDRFYDPDGAFRDCMPANAVDPLMVQAGKSGQWQREATKSSAKIIKGERGFLKRNAPH